MKQLRPIDELLKRRRKLAETIAKMEQPPLPVEDGGVPPALRREIKESLQEGLRDLDQEIAERTGAASED